MLVGVEIVVFDVFFTGSLELNCPAALVLVRVDLAAMLIGSSVIILAVLVLIVGVDFVGSSALVFVTYTFRFGADVVTFARGNDFPVVSEFSLTNNFLSVVGSSVFIFVVEMVFSCAGGFAIVEFLGGIDFL